MYGTAYGLAISDGRLLVSTDLGTIYCYDSSGEPYVDIHDDRAKPVRVDSDFQQLAEEIIKRSGMTRGFCLDLGCGDGQLSMALAQQTELRIIAVDDDLAAVQRARVRLAAAGLLGTRVTVHHRDLAATGYPKYFANLLVSGRSATESDTVLSDEAMGRLLRPYGGVACVGPRDALQVDTRGELVGAGSWTHQYANPANTLNKIGRAHV